MKEFHGETRLFERKKLFRNLPIVCWRVAFAEGLCVLQSKRRRRWFLLGFGSPCNSKQRDCITTYTSRENTACNGFSETNLVFFLGSQRGNCKLSHTDNPILLPPSKSIFHVSSNIFSWSWNLKTICK